MVTAQLLELPMPERVVRYRFDNPSLPTEMLTVGVATITHDNDGLKLNPHKAVLFAFGQSNGTVTANFDLQPSTARMLAERIVEMCDYIENSLRRSTTLLDDIERPSS